MNGKALPFRFNLSSPMADRWQAMSDETHCQLFAKFATIDSLTAFVQHSAPVKLGRDVYLTSGFELAVELANRHKLSLPALANAFSIWAAIKLRAKQSVRGEVELTAEWARLLKLRHTLEVPCAVGRIDVLLFDNKLIVEAKLAGDWKHALGQVIAYKYCLGSSFSASLLLLGRHRNLLAEECCAQQGIQVFMYAGDLKLCDNAKLLAKRQV